MYSILEPVIHERMKLQEYMNPSPELLNLMQLEAM
jgi:hypothetical protein